jgi:hypothetical protein
LKNWAILIHHRSITNVLGRGLLRHLAMFYKSARSARIVTVTVGSTQSVASRIRNRIGTAVIGVTVGAKGTTREVYPAADFVGRCFLRACYWFDVCTSWAKRYNPPVFTPDSAKAHAPVTVSSATMGAVLNVQSTIATRTQNKA